VLKVKEEAVEASEAVDVEMAPVAVPVAPVAVSAREKSGSPRPSSVA